MRGNVLEKPSWTLVCLCEMSALFASRFASQLLDRGGLRRGGNDFDRGLSRLGPHDPPKEEQQNRHGCNEHRRGRSSRTKYHKTTRSSATTKRMALVGGFSTKDVLTIMASANSDGLG